VLSCDEKLLPLQEFLSPIFCLLVWAFTPGQASYTLSRCLVTSNVKCFFFFLAGKVTLNVAFAAYPKLENDSPCEILPFPDSAVTPTMKNCFCVTGCEMFVDA
jgi:hypothetical protein